MNTEGICMICREWTDARESCCGAAVWVEGSVIHPDLFDDNGNLTEESENEN